MRSGVQAVLGAAAIACFAAGAGAQADSVAPAGEVVPGVEVLLADSLHLLRGKRVGLITNHTGRDREGTSTIDLLHRAPDVRLVALFGPEHGLRGVARGGAHIASGVDSATGVPIHSLYGRTLVPTARMLENVDVLLYDIQDIGARPYTYVWTMALAAAAAKRPFIVLDRPNPIRGDRIEGGTIEPAYRTFTGRYPVTLRYGLTPGELLRWLVGTGQISADITVIPMRGYRRSMWYDETGLPWIAPSPNIRDLETALLYPGMVFFEALNLSEGRGTDAPLRLFGASWLTDAPAIARELEAMRMPGVRFVATRRRVAPGEEFGGRTIPMIEMIVTDRDSIRPIDAAAYAMRVIYRRHPREWRFRGRGIEELSGSRALRNAIQRPGGVARLLKTWAAESERFRVQAEPFRLYPP